MEDKVRITFGFSLYAVFLQVTLVIYFKKELHKLNELKPLENNKMCCC